MTSKSIYWPEIPFTRWRETGQSLHMQLQIVGKFRLALTPWMNHSWQATFYVTPRGLTTSTVYGPDAAYEVVFDFVDHALKVLASDGREVQVPLAAMPVADFHAAFVEAVREIGADCDMHGAPNEVPDATPFRKQTDGGAYDPDAARDFHRALLSVDRTFRTFRTGFLGKSSPSHLFWGSFDLAVTRFSGRTAPLHPGGFPALPDEVTREAYSHEVSSAGFWPGGGGVEEAAFYCYAYPTPDGFGDQDPGHPDAYFHKELGEYILPYAAVATSANPHTALMGFLQATYEAAADRARWDRSALECGVGEPRRPRAV